MTALGNLRRSARTLVFILVWAPSVVAAGPTSAPSSPKDIFAAGRVHTIELRMSAQRWSLLEPGAGSRAMHAATRPIDGVAVRPAAEGYAYVKTEVEFDGQTIADVGIRFKGGMSYSVSTGSPRRPMKLDFERFVPGGHFAGLGTLNLNNQALDTSQSREALAFELFRELDVPASRTGYAIVYLTVTGVYDREFLGLYTLIEEVDRRFLKKHFATAEGLLCKPEGMRGLACFGDDWNQYAARYRPKGEVDPKLARRMMELAKLVHRADDATFRDNIESYVDVDEFLRYVVVNAALANFDSFLSTGHNYYLYLNPHDGRVSFIPWDMNMAFAGYTWVGTQAQIADLSITRPYVDYNRIIERVLAIKKYNDAYRQHVQRLIEGPFAPERMRKRVSELGALVEQAGEAARKAGKAASPTTRPTVVARLHPPELMPFVAMRVASMRLQLEGKRPGFVPAFRDPDLVLAEWAGIVRPVAALMTAMDSDGDGRLSEAEVSRTTAQILSAAHVKPGGSLDASALAAALSTLLTEDLRKCAGPEAWAKWIIRLADANHDQRVDAAEMMSAFQRMVAGADRDFDAMLGGREMLEAVSGLGPP